MQKQKIHRAVQRADGSIYCYCDNMEGRWSCGINYAKKKIICSCCGKEVKF